FDRKAAHGNVCGPAAQLTASIRAAKVQERLSRLASLLGLSGHICFMEGVVLCRVKATQNSGRTSRKTPAFKRSHRAPLREWR
ncbi:MAG TPA: hypothetical protein VGG24_16910, partial [Paraburkholderia sp.]